MSFVKIWVHAVWSTKHRLPLLTGDTLHLMCEHIRSNAADKGFYIDTINGHDDHLHVLMVLKTDFSVSKQMQLIKGESSKWATDTDLVSGTFAWESQYYAASVSGANVPVVRAYIKNQQAHHANVTFAAEFDHLVSSAGFDLESGDQSELPMMIRTATAKPDNSSN